MEQTKSKSTTDQNVSVKNENSLPEVAPWPDPVDPMLLLNEISCLVKRFIVCEREVVIATTLWTAMTWFMDVIHVAPIAVITAPEKRCGKSQLLHLMSLMVCRPIPASKIRWGVIIEAKHLCMMMRGVEKQNSIMTTSVMLGLLREDPRTRSEFLSLVKGFE